MLENQAFRWLKNSVKPPAVGSPTSAAISACSEPAVLVRGVAQDFDALLRHHDGNGASASEAEGTAEGTTAVNGGASDAAASDAAASDAASDAASSDASHRDDLTARLDRIKTLLYEERSASASAAARDGALRPDWTPRVATGVCQEVTLARCGAAGSGGAAGELLPLLVRRLPLLPFEARKSVAAIFNYLLVCGLDGADAPQFARVSAAFAAHVRDRADAIVTALVRAHDGAGGGAAVPVDVALLCGSMLRSSLRHPDIYAWTLADGRCERLVYPFLDAYVHDPNFDVGSDALETVRAMLTGAAGGAGGAAGAGPDDAASAERRRRMEELAAGFLRRRYDDVVDARISGKCLAAGANYMTRRQMLRMLASLLLDRANYSVMMTYVAAAPNLVTILLCLRDPSPHITLDAFQVFKIFVANPSKPPEVVKILFDNKVKLVKYLEGLHKDRENSDEQYRDEKRLVISTLEQLEI